MFIKRKLIPFILCLILLIPLFGCSSAENTVVESASAPVAESSKPSPPKYDTEPPVSSSIESTTSSELASNEAEKIDYSNREPAYLIEPLTELMYGELNYDEYFSEERIVQVTGNKVYPDNLPQEIIEKSSWAIDGKPYVKEIPNGYLACLSESELWWYSSDFSESLLIRRVQEYNFLGSVIVYEDMVLWNEFIRPANITYTYRLHLPSLDARLLIDEDVTPLTKYIDDEYYGVSTDAFNVFGKSTNKGFLVYCANEEDYYHVTTKDFVEGRDLWVNLQELR